MRRIRLTQPLLVNSLLATLSVVACTLIMLLIGRTILGEAVIGMLYLVPIVWSASRWGQLPGVSAALTAALLFDFFFVPPFYTFTIGSLEGWMVLAIFFAVAIVVVGRIQDSLSKAHEATFMYELSSILANVRTQEAVAYATARYIRQLFQAKLVAVTFHQSKQSERLVVSEPPDAEEESNPDRVLPLLTAWGLAGEIQIWRGEYAELPAVESHLLQNFASQAARAFEHNAPSSETSENGNVVKGLAASVSAK